MKSILTTNICGIECENPYLLASSCVAGNYKMCAHALDLGWAGLIYKSISLHSPIEVSPRFEQLGGYGLPFLGFRNIENVSDRKLSENLTDIYNLKKDYPNKIIIASIMADSYDDWNTLSKLCEDNGADAIEFNISCPHMDKENMGISATKNISYIKEVCAKVSENISIPVLAKIGPSALPISLIVETVMSAGAKGISITNTYPSISNFDFDKYSYSPSISGKSSKCGYSGRAIHPMALAQIADVAKIKQNIYISGIGGIYTWKDALEAILLGASTVQLATAVMEYGYRIIDDLISGLTQYLTRHNQSLSDVIGVAVDNIVQPSELHRGKYYLPTVNESNCIGCGRCYLSCRDAGHQAINWIDNIRKPEIVEERCAGCHLCKMVCPSQSIKVLTQ